MVRAVLLPVSMYSNKKKKSVAWHPHVAHWLASCGQDGSVRVWDARATRQPVRDARLAHAGGG